MEDQQASLASNHKMTQGIHVLVVDPERPSLGSTSRMLEMFSYKVTAVQSGSEALSMLSNGKKKIDLLLADIRLADVNAFVVLHEAAKRDVPTILMSLDEDAIVAKLALENGAWLFLPKPVSSQVIKILWQYVIRWRLKATDVEKQDHLLEMVNENIGKFSDSETVSDEKYEMEVNSKRKRNDTNGRGVSIHEDGKIGSKKQPEKIFTEWTEELHQKFVAAACQLGEGRCYPKDILDLMNVPGLTRLQVASHLQKCRNGNWHGAETSRSANVANVPAYIPKGVTKKYGIMPPLPNSSNYPQLSLQLHTQGNTSPDILSTKGQILSSTSSSSVSAPYGTDSHSSSTNQNPPADDFSELFPKNGGFRRYPK